MAISTVNSSLEAVWQQFQLQQARRNVEQAEQRANSLQAQASSAQQAADRAQTAARALSSQASQAQSAANLAQIQLQGSNAASQLGAQINVTLEQVIPKPAATPPATATPAPAAVTNSEGQTIGTVVNTTA